MHQPLADCNLPDLYEDTGIFLFLGKDCQQFLLQMSSLVAAGHPSPMAELVSCLDEHRVNHQEKVLQKAFWWLLLLRNKGQISLTTSFA